MIPFSLYETINILERTPSMLNDLLAGISDPWAFHNEGGNTWSPFDIVGHLIEGENNNWIPRIQIILSDQPDKRYVPFDRFSQLDGNKEKTMAGLLNEFTRLRKINLDLLRSFRITEGDLDKTGIHPEFGAVTLRQQLATWAAHDLSHFSQITRVMARQYREAVGPWTRYLTIMGQ
jgi:hypothetical protein